MLHRIAGILARRKVERGAGEQRSRGAGEQRCGGVEEWRRGRAEDWDIVIVFTGRKTMESEQHFSFEIQ